ncbi:MAG: discoidin domain-containing protein, partial [Verrucomicrobia bacterium]|nr:discoidin domain-containing protein [Verrucomicrobiota bacterium]
ATVAEKAALPAIRDQARGAALRQLERKREAWTPATTTVVSRLLAATNEAALRQQLVALLARANDKPALRLAESLRSDSALAADAAYAAGAINAALAGPPKLRASPSSGVANLLDGKTGTRWSAPALGEEWVEIDFRKNRPLRRLTLDQTGRAAEYPEHYEVYVTDDPKTPGPAVLSGRGERNRTVLDFPAGTKGRYVVIKNVAERKDTPWTICELYID